MSADIRDLVEWVDSEIKNYSALLETISPEHGDLEHEDYVSHSLSVARLVQVKSLIYENQAMDIVLGIGDKLISDAFNIDEGWAGIVISGAGGKKYNVGELVDAEAATDNDLDARIRIMADNTDSLDVLIEAIERAKMWLKPL